MPAKLIEREKPIERSGAIALQEAVLQPLQIELASVKADYTALLSLVMGLEERLIAVEGKAHADHTIGAGAIEHIVGLAVTQVEAKVDARVRELIGHSGLPARGDEA